ncbi:MAG TPA: GNAT family N-acetyltransferase [Thermomonospora sp.]|nr:GNAT family N-acetyltransferase [Thermomonospora sp.]
MNPTLRTARLELRPVTPADHAALLEHWSDPLVTRYLFDGAPPTAEQVTGIIDDSRRDFAAAGYGVWAVRPVGRRGAPDPGLIGTAGLRGLAEEGRTGDDVEVLYSLRPDRWGSGLAAEAVGAVLEHAFTALGLPRVLAKVDEANRASAALARRLGMRATATEPGTLGPVTRLAVDRDAWAVSRHGPPGR